jgi:two-component system response regulator MtrA
VILDLMLPGTYGLDILRDVRPHTETPFLILSARSDVHDRVRALKLGADDYLTKPFWPDELVERVRARLRRPALVRTDGVIEVGALRLDVAGHAARVNGAPVELTRAELALIAALAQSPGVVRTRAWLADRVLATGEDADARGLDAHVSRMRKKLGPLVRIETVWGIGYRLANGGER